MSKYKKVIHRLRAKISPTMDRKSIEEMITSARYKASQHSHFLKENMHDFKAMLRMLKAFANGSYRQIPWRSISYAIASLVYFINPLDLIPDFIVGPGLFDDAAVVILVLKSIRGDIKKFETWEKGGKTPPAVETEPNENAPSV